jgi:hypothetical protein
VNTGVKRDTSTRRPRETRRTTARSSWLLVALQARRTTMVRSLPT